MTPKLKRTSLTWKIFKYLLGFCLLMLLIMWLFQTVLLERFYTAIKLAQVQREAAALAEWYEAGDMASFEASVQNRGDLLVELVDEQGYARMFGGFRPEGLYVPFADEQKTVLYQQTLASGGAMSMRYDSSAPEDALPEGAQRPEGEPPAAVGGQRPPGMGRQQDSILQTRILTGPEGSQVMLMVSAGITPVQATVQTLRVQLVCISAVMLVLAVALAILMARRVARPIVKLNRAAARLGEGDYDAGFPAGGYREVAQLSATLSQTAGELAKTENLRRELIANVSHDLRTPLTLITGYAEMMRDIPGEDNAENMQVIIDEARRLSSLVGDLLDLSALQAGTAPLRLEPIDLSSLAESIIGRFARFSEPEGFTVTYTHTGGATVLGDEARLSQVVYNFLINAMAHGGPDKTIRVRLQTENARALVEVQDTGAGIAPEDLPYIWDRYYKVDKVHKRAAAGAGLGLSIVKSILEQHPGIAYGARSAPGEGSTFWFSLPIV